ncbi:LacI family transcriptional regulator [Nocardioides aromaticivorans]|uniref:LacI family transcriptional regulator n=1 Tax=Nocardioides aromaticivorans TaxID=200618 RepID=A0A7Y9ZJV8_9ACTN|nr:LacI family DNA-binding transcriptional regulator [Nocardioides aromaticivorans]NYI45683.1 LacI family transcriptional regulator [Nocardioides aromaticivorans]
MTLPKRVTITDVAEAAGVAASTVSRALSTPGRVNATTREHILEVAERLGYVPNPSARAMSSGRTHTFALLVPDITNPYFAGAIKGAERAAAAAGKTLVLGDTQESPSVERELVQRLGPAVDGLVIAAARGTDEDLAAAAGRHRLALVNRTLPGVAGVPSVVADYDAGTRQIVDHLVSLGHESLVFLAGPHESWSGARRWAGLLAAAESSGVAARRLGPYQPTLQGGPAAADAALAARATAIVCHNDMLAIGVLRRLAGRGVRVPDDVSVVGFDDMFGADFCQPALTTLAERTEDAGACAIDLLLRPGSAATVVVPTQLKVRDSTGPCR